MWTPEGCQETSEEDAELANATHTNKHQRLTLKDWPDVLGHSNPAAVKHLDKREIIDVTDATVAFIDTLQRLRVCKEYKSEALSYG